MFQYIMLTKIKRIKISPIINLHGTSMHEEIYETVDLTNGRDNTINETDGETCQDLTERSNKKLNWSSDLEECKYHGKGSSQISKLTPTTNKLHPYSMQK